jgi:GT2 family glycosyltransferase
LRLSLDTCFETDGSVDVVIVNWNSGDMLATCIDGLAVHCANVIGKLIIVDNASTDSSPDCPMPASLEVDLIRAPYNLGFAAACNLGAARSEADYLLFANPDLIIGQDILTHPLRRLRGDAAIGAVGIGLYDAASGQRQRTCCRLPTSISMLARSLGIDRLWPRLGYRLSGWDHATSRKVDHVIGACYLTPRAVFDRLGGFDERFFVYLEDLDFSARIQQAGMDILYLANPCARHVGGGSSRQVKAERLFYMLRSRLQYVHKHMGVWGLIIVGFSTLVIEPLLRIMASVAAGSTAGCGEVLRGYGLLYRWLCS